MIRIENLVKRYGKKYALDSISLDISKGEVIGFLGPNGAGKSTTMNIITGYLSATSGNVYIDGIDLLSDPQTVKTMIGYLPEQPPLYVDMTVREYLNFVFDLKKCTYSRKKHIDEICSVVKIADVQNRVIRNLSKGYKQRVGIAQALVGNPPIIIFDEPTVGLDPKEIIEIRSLIRKLGEKHTVILSTHILSEVQVVCDRIIIIDSGRIIADKPTEELARVAGTNKKYNVKISGPLREVLSMLKEHPGVKSAEATGENDNGTYTFILETDANTDIRRSLFSALTEYNWPMMGLEEINASLEDIFISIVDSKYESEKSSEGTRASWDDADEEI
ncbi:MAG: ATP-binding cassette domain-containing protein [Clostridia bacterium]|nr:ATP-binding cassette domain-containing protein [Clostridia bacterium]